MSLGAGFWDLPENFDQQGILGTLSWTGQPVMANRPALQHPGCRVLPHCQLSHYLSLDRWPLMGVAQSPGQKRSQAGPPQDDIWCGGRRGRGRKGGLFHIPGLGVPRAFPGQRSAPSGDRAGQGRAKQGKTGQGRSGPTQATARVQGSLMTAVFCCRFPSCSGREAVWGGGGEAEGQGGEGGSKQETTESASSLCSENTSRLRSPVGGCMCGNETGRGRERGKSKQALPGCYPPTSPFPTHQPTPLWSDGVGGRRFTKRPPPGPRSCFSCR